jgi:hypothetical protein
MSKGHQRTLDRAALKGGTLRPHKIPFDVEITVPDPGDAVAFSSAVIGALPQGNIMLLGAVMYAQFTDVGGDGLIAAFAGDFAVGTAATADGDFGDAGEANIIQSTELLAATGTTPRIRALTANTSGVLTSNVTILDNTDGDLELNLNLLIDNASIDDEAVVRAQGVLYLAYMVMGDD